MPVSSSGAFSKLGGAFGLNFSTKQLPIRRPTALTVISSYGDLFASDLSEDISDPVLRLGTSEWSFEDGSWLSSSNSISSGSSMTQNGTAVSDSRTQAPTTTSATKAQLAALKDENNLLVLKNEALLDMLSEVVAEMHLREDEDTRQ